MPERLQKFLARSGIGSRRFCESLIKSNKIFVNEKVATIGTSVREEMLSNTILKKFITLKRKVKSFL